MFRDGHPYCDLCGPLMVRTSTDDDGNVRDVLAWEADNHCCETCWDTNIDRDFQKAQPCLECDSRPCERGWDCWFVPPTARNLVGLTYFSKRVAEGTCER